MEDLLKLQTWNSKIKGQFRLSVQSKGDHDQGRDTIAFIPRQAEINLRKKSLEKISFWVFVTSVYFWGQLIFTLETNLLVSFFFFFLVKAHSFDDLLLLKWFLYSAHNGFGGVQGLSLQLIYQIAFHLKRHWSKEYQVKKEVAHSK